MEKLKDLCYERRFQILCEQIATKGNPLVHPDGFFENPINISDVEPFLELNVFKLSILQFSNVIQIYQSTRNSAGNGIASFTLFGNALARSDMERHDFLFWLYRDMPGAVKAASLLYGVKFENEDRILDTLSMHEEVYRVSAKIERLYTVFRGRFVEWCNSGMSVDLLAGWVPGFSRAVYESIITQSFDEYWPKKAA